MDEELEERGREKVGAGSWVTLFAFFLSLFHGRFWSFCFFLSGLVESMDWFETNFVPGLMFFVIAQFLYVPASG